MSNNILDKLYDSEAFRTLTKENAGDEYRAVMDRLVKAEKELKQACERCPEVFGEYQYFQIIKRHTGQFSRKERAFTLSTVRE